MTLVQTISDPISDFPIGPKLYQIRILTMSDINPLRTETGILAASSNKPLAGEIAKAYATMTRTMIAGDHPELTDAFITSWLSPALCTMIAPEIGAPRYGLLSKTARCRNLAWTPRQHRQVVCQEG